MDDVEELVKNNSEKVQRLINEKLEEVVADSNASIKALNEKLSKLETA